MSILIYRSESTSLKYLNDSKAFIEYSNDVKVFIKILKDTIQAKKKDTDCI